jgi:hypothetical protein
MQSSFELSSRAARAAIAVPPIPLDAIRHGAEYRPNKSAGRRRRGVLAAAAASLSIVAVAAAAEMFGHVQISFEPSGAVRVAFDGTGGRLSQVQHPTEQDIRNAARALNFPAILPKGLPSGTTGAQVMVLGPGAMEIAYNLPGAWRRSNHLLFVILANPKSVASDSTTPPKSKFTIQQSGSTAGSGTVRWMVGQEEVIVLKSTITAAELAHFKAVMTAQAHEST